MANSVYHVAPNDGEWTVDNEKIGRASLIFTSKDEALNRVKNLVEDEKSKILVHGNDGSVEDVISPAE